jgi:hypothetical protein
VFEPTEITPLRIGPKSNRNVRLGLINFSRVGTSSGVDLFPCREKGDLTINSLPAINNGKPIVYEKINRLSRSCHRVASGNICRGTGIIVEASYCATPTATA